jgi:3-hydroxyacyl-[acyl-carrier-protein] dehydratase
VDLSRVLPHRPPMVLVDRVEDVTPGHRLTGLRTVRADQDFYADGLPAYLVLESWLQSAAVLLAGVAPARVVYVGGLRDVLLGRSVLAGETVEHSVRIVRSVGDLAVCAGSSAVGADPVLRVGQVTVTWREPDR